MFHSFIELFRRQEKLSDKWVLLLIFLFPIAGPVVRHWNSSIFILLSFTALYFLFKKKDRKILQKEEKIYLWTFFLFFVVFLVSTISNRYSWERIQLEGLGTEIDFLLFIPIYLLIRQNDDVKKAFFAGILLSIPIIFLFSLHEYYYQPPNKNFLEGAYSQLFLGPITALSLLMSLYAYKHWFNDNRWLWFLAPLFISMGLFIISFSAARIAYITIFFSSIFIILFQIKNLKLILVSFAIIILTSVTLYQINTIKLRTNTAITNFSKYFSKSADVISATNTSVGMRLEAWRSSQYIFKERPFVGIGNGNYPTVIKKYIKEGLVSPSVMEMGQAHNTFIEALISKGVIGLILLIMIFYFPVYTAWKNNNQAHLSFVTISAFATAITLMSLGESMLINKNNGVSNLLIFSAVLFSTLIQEINKSK